MKTNLLSFMRRVLVFVALLAASWLLDLTTAKAADTATSASTTTTTNDATADKAWHDVVKASHAPSPPDDWATNRPTREEMAKYYVPALVKAADLAKVFYTQYPGHPKARDAHDIEYKMLDIATERFGDTNNAARFESLQTARASDPNASEDDRVELQINTVRKLLSETPSDLDERLVKIAHSMKKDFPKRPETYQVYMLLLSRAEGDKAAAIAKEIQDSDAPAQVKDEAAGVLKRMGSVGKPVDIQYTAVDGREVDVSKLKGKVVLVDFWATWCGPCMGELPHVKEAYEKYHDKGFEIVGISFDQDKESLQRVVKDREMTWPQYFDGKGWGNKFGQQFGIDSIPTMWLVDKKGNLQDVNARDGLADKIGKLLAE